MSETAIATEKKVADFCHRVVGLSLDKLIVLRKLMVSRLTDIEGTPLHSVQVALIDYVDVYIKKIDGGSDG